MRVAQRSLRKYSINPHYNNIQADPFIDALPAGTRVL